MRQKARPCGPQARAWARRPVPATCSQPRPRGEWGARARHSPVVAQKPVGACAGGVSCSANHGGGAAPRGQGLMPLRRAPLASGRGVRADCRSVPCVRREAQKGKNAVARPGCCSKACGADR